MVKASTLLVITLSALLPTLASARACTTGLMYCGHTLLDIGKYRDEINAELNKHGKGITQWNVYQSIYECGSGGHGWIGYKGVCENGCRNEGWGNSDRCI